MRNKVREKEIASQRVKRLLKLADEIYREDKNLAIAYGDLARRIAMRSRVRVPKEWRWRFCKHCKKLLYPGINMSVRVRSKRMSHLVLRCSECGMVSRLPY
ncbi:MAG: ribonuclease P [Candidatus Korarchaeum sp.]|nr:ribonuclease P [Candidatus Korarchaeum sp.]